MPIFRLLPALLPELLLPLALVLFWLLAQAASARLPASSSAAVFIIRARRKTISSLGGICRRCYGTSRWVQEPVPPRPDRPVRTHDAGHAIRVSGALHR